MAKNEIVVEHKPSNSFVEVTQPSNSEVVEVSPNNLSAFDEKTTNQLYSVTLGRGMPIGLLLTLTYPEDVQIISPIQ